MTLKVGIVGARGIGERHARAYLQDPLAELVAVCDLVKERADEAAQMHGVRGYTSLTEMLRHEELDIVDVSTGGAENGSWHFEPTIEALEAGKHVLVEKPISNQIEEARQMVAKAAEMDRYLGCNLNHNFTPPAEKARQYMERGQIGEPIYCLHKMGFSGGEQTYQKSGAPNAAGFPYFHVKAFLAHPFSVMRHFCGDVSHVQAFLHRPTFRKEADDPMLSVNSIHVQFANGAAGYLLSQRGDATFGLGGWWSVEVGGTRGTFCIENCIEKITYWPSPTVEGSEPPQVSHSGITDFNQTFPRRIHAFLEDVGNGVPKSALRASGRDALATLEYTWAAIESYENGSVLVQPHPLPDCGDQ